MKILYVGGFTMNGYCLIPKCIVLGFSTLRGEMIVNQNVQGRFYRCQPTRNEGKYAHTREKIYWVT